MTKWYWATAIAACVTVANNKWFASCAQQTNLRKNPNSCNFGMQPGLWVGQEWTTLSRACPLKSFVPNRTGPHHTVAQDLGILYLGDSVAWGTVKDFCDTDGQPESSLAVEVHSIEYGFTCARFNISIAYQSTIGVAPAGPYYHGRVGSPFARATRVRLCFKSPDLLNQQQTACDAAALLFCIAKQYAYCRECFQPCSPAGAGPRVKQTTCCRA